MVTQFSFMAKLSLFYSLGRGRQSIVSEESMYPTLEVGVLSPRTKDSDTTLSRSSCFYSTAILACVKRLPVLVAACAPPNRMPGCISRVLESVRPIKNIK